MDLRCLQIFWPLPPQREHYLASPTRYVSHLLGHEGEGSILSYLKAKGWANELSAGGQFDQTEFASMDVSIDLVRTGLSPTHPPTHPPIHTYIQVADTSPYPPTHSLTQTDEGVEKVEEVLKVVYAYLHLIRTAGPQKYVFEEMQQTAANSFRFLSKQQPMSYTSSLVSTTHPPTHPPTPPPPRTQPTHPPPYRPIACRNTLPSTSFPVPTSSESTTQHSFKPRLTRSHPRICWCWWLRKHTQVIPSFHPPTRPPNPSSFKLLSMP